MSIGSLWKPIIKSLFKKPATRLYPFEVRPYPIGSRGNIQIDLDICTFCTACQRKCPTGAIIVEREAKTWVIEPLKCITCNACVEACPKGCLRMSTQHAKSTTTGCSVLTR